MSETAAAPEATPAVVTPPAGDPGNALATAAPAASETDAPAEGAAPKEPAAEEVERVGAPEDYEFTPPEGQELNQDQFAEWKGKAKAAGLTQSQFDKLTVEAIGMVNAMQASRAEAWHSMQRDWQSQISADPEIAGTAPGTLNDGARAAAARVFSAYGGDALKEALIVTGAGNHPAIVKAFVAMGKAMGEETNVGVVGQPDAPNASPYPFYKPMN